MFDAAAWVGRTVLGEHRLEVLSREDSAVALFAAVSVVDGGAYAVVVPKSVVPQTGSISLEEAVARAGRHAVGVAALSTLLHARCEGDGEAARLVAVRRGAVLPGLASLLADGPRESGEVARIVAPVGLALASLHDQGLAHGAVSSTTLVVRDGALMLDLFGLSAAAEAAGGARAAREIVPEPYRPPELRGASPTAPGPWSDTYALALAVVALLAGRDDVLSSVEEGLVPTPRTLGIDVPDRVEDILRLALAVSPSPRPSIRTLVRDLTRHADPVSRGSGPTPPPSRGSGATSEPLAGTAVVAPPLAPSLAPPPRDSSTIWLALAIAAGLGVFGLAMAGAVVYVLHEPSAASGTAATTPSPISPPPSGAPPPPTASAFAPPVTPPRVHGPPTYPTDEVALIPVAPDEAVRGDRDALVTLVIFGDLSEPFTARVLEEIPRLEGRYGGDLRVVFKLFPVAGSVPARATAEAGAIVLSRAGADAFFHFAEGAAKSTTLDGGRLEELGIKAGLPAGTITDGLSRHTSAKLVDRDVDLGRRLGMRGAPVLMINGRRLDGFQPFARLLHYLDYEAVQGRDTLAKGVPRDRLYAVRVTANVTTSEGEVRPPGLPPLAGSP